MRLVFFDDYRLGVVQGDRIADATAALGDIAGVSPQDRLLMIISGWADLRPQIERVAQAAPTRPLRGTRLRAPVPRPTKIVCAARNYRENGVHRTIPIEFFLKSTEAVLEPAGTVELPPQQATIFHHEAELALVIGRTARAGQGGRGARLRLRLPAVRRRLGARALRRLLHRQVVRHLRADGAGDRDRRRGARSAAARDRARRQRRAAPALRHRRHGEHDRGADRARLGDHDAAARRRASRPGTNHQGLGALQDGDKVSLRIANWPALEFSVSDPEKRSWPRGVDEATAERARTPR